MAAFHIGAMLRVIATVAALCAGQVVIPSWIPEPIRRSEPCKVAGPVSAGGVSHGGSLSPGCMCPSGLEGNVDILRSPVTPANGTTYVIAPKPGEVEVVTVDVKTANWVRCNNVSVAEDVAKLLKIPMQRVTVTPWSWTPSVPQSNYLAFVQEDHERCDCSAGDGQTLQSAGFRQADAAKALDGAQIAADPHGTQVITVAQYQALQGQMQTFAAPQPSATPDVRARVQMLTRDPCLVKMLRLYTDWYREHLASLLEVPIDKLLIDPPPVQGTVGLLQLDSSVSLQRVGGKSEEVRQVPVMAVHQCSLIEFHQRMQRLNLSQSDPSPAPASSSAATAPSPASNVANAAPAPAQTGAAPAPLQPPLAPAPSYMVGPVYNTSNNTNASNATNATAPVPPQKVSLTMRLDNIDYDKFAESWSLISTFETIVKGAIGASGHVSSDATQLALYPGSVVVTATITPPQGTAGAAVAAFINNTVCPETVSRLNAMGALVEATTGVITCTQVSLEVLNPPFPEDETNRAWIAFWTVVVLPPYSDEGSWRLLNLANDPHSEVTKLFPLTLARVPGLKDRQIGEPNSAIETRLPPPLDKALGFKLPKPINEEEAMKKEMERIKKEERVEEGVIKAQEDVERLQIRKTMKNLRKTRRTINHVDRKILRAAKAHVAALFNGTGEGPDIVPWGVLTKRSLESESPYPWEQQIPPPQPAMLPDLALLEKKQNVLRR